jgi:hypothetical protein
MAEGDVNMIDTSSNKVVEEEKKNANALVDVDILIMVKSA